MAVGPQLEKETPKFRSPEEILVGKKSLAEILKAHKQWLETNRHSSDRAVLDGADLSRANLSGANLQKARLNETKLSGANLSEANLCEAQLNRADLSGANLQKAELKKAQLLEANLEAASLDVAQLQKANLSQANLRGASLHWADLTEADLLETQLQGADLLKARLGAANFEGTDLTGAKGLLSGQLGGTVLAGAKLTQDLTKFEALGVVEEVSKNARKVFVAILLGCLYCLLTIAVTTDADLLMGKESAPLPFVDRSIPIVHFFFVAPLLLFVLYLYFHFYMQNLWAILATLPAVFPDGIPLHEKAYPWLLNGRVRSHFARLTESVHSLSRWRELISVFLGWWVVPLILLLIWGRYLRCQEWGLTAVHVVLAAIAIVSAYWLNQLAAATLRGGVSLIGEDGARAQRVTVAGTGLGLGLHQEGRENRGRPFWKGVLSRVSLLFVVGAAFGLLSVGAIRGVEPDASNMTDSRTWVPRVLALFHYSPFPDLTEGEFSLKPAGWTGQEELEEIYRIEGPGLAGKKMRFAQAESVFLVRADLVGADLEGANLSYAQLQGSQLSESILEGAKLKQANLKGANLAGARLRGANLEGAWLQKADLMDADLREAHLQETDGWEAQLQYADLRDAHLDLARFQGADFSHAQLDSASLEAAKLQGAVFEESRLRSARLKGADLQGANLRNADLQEADLYGADLRDAEGLTASQVQAAANWRAAFYSETFLKEIGLPDNHNRTLEKQLKQSRGGSGHKD